MTLTGNKRYPQATNGGGRRISRTPFAEPDRAMPGKPLSDRRLNVYIDGYNFYVPLSRTGKESDYELAWCNFLRLGEYLVETLGRENRQFAGCQLGGSCPKSAISVRRAAVAGRSSDRSPQ